MKKAKVYHVEYVDDSGVKGWRSVALNLKLFKWRFLSKSTFKNPKGAFAEIAEELDIDPKKQYFKVEVKDYAHK